MPAVERHLQRLELGTCVACVFRRDMGGTCWLGGRQASLITSIRAHSPSYKNAVQSCTGQSPGGWAAKPHCTSWCWWRLRGCVLVFQRELGVLCCALLAVLAKDTHMSMPCLGSAWRHHRLPGCAGLYRVAQRGRVWVHGYACMGENVASCDWASSCSSAVCSSGWSMLRTDAAACAAMLCDFLYVRQHALPSDNLGCVSCMWAVLVIQLQQTTVLGVARPVLSLTGPVVAGRLNLQATTTPGLCACVQLCGVCDVLGLHVRVGGASIAWRRRLCPFSDLLLSRCATTAASIAEPKSTECTLWQLLLLWPLPTPLPLAGLSVSSPGQHPGRASP